MASDKVVRAAAISYGLKEQFHSTVLWKSVRVCCVVRTEHEWWGKYAGWEAHHREGKWKETGLWDKSLNSERMLGGPTWPTEMGGGVACHANLGPRWSASFSWLSPILSAGAGKGAHLPLFEAQKRAQAPRPGLASFKSPTWLCAP